MDLVFLIGMSRAGKTETGRVLSKRLNIEFLDTDDLLIKKYGSLIPLLYANAGECGFREKEYIVFKEMLALHKKAVISTGGGFADNRQALKLLIRYKHIVLLDTAAELIFERIKKQAEQTGSYPQFLGGSIKNDSDAKKHFFTVYNRRIAVYKKIASVQIITDGISFDETATKIINNLK